MALPQCSNPVSEDLFKLNSPMNPKDNWTLSETIAPFGLCATQWYLPLLNIHQTIRIQFETTTHFRITNSDSSEVFFK